MSGNRAFERRVGAGVLGLLQCVALIEQCLSKGWIENGHVNQCRAIARRATRRMHDLYWQQRPPFR